MIITSGPKVPDVQGLLFSEAGFDDGPELEAMYAEAQGAIEELTGAPLLATDVQSLYIALPPGRSYDDKALLVVRSGRRDGQVSALVDVVRDHPEPGVWWIGFMMVHPRLQRRGIGQQVVRGVVRWAAALGARRVSLECPREPAGVQRFFASSGFHVESETADGWIMTTETSSTGSHPAER